MSHKYYIRPRLLPIELTSNTSYRFDFPPYPQIDSGMYKYDIKKQTKTQDAFSVIYA
jgi:hypothetical protein